MGEALALPSPKQFKARYPPGAVFGENALEGVDELRWVSHRIANGGAENSAFDSGLQRYCHDCTSSCGNATHSATLRQSLFSTGHWDGAPERDVW